jgi:hypothetical protein
VAPRGPGGLCERPFATLARARDAVRLVQARGVIVLLLEGGMSHLKSWDPKPRAPALLTSRTYSSQPFLTKACPGRGLT